MSLLQRKCPACGNTNARRSAFQFHELTPRNVFRSPYRCRDCGLRFWVVSRASLWAIATVVLVALVTAAIAWKLATPRDPPAEVVDPGAAIPGPVRAARADGAFHFPHNPCAPTGAGTASACVHRGRALG
jgi:predicted RNA-binding Zn-ribbon protein involved in translation (DUF1610 family)